MQKFFKHIIIPILLFTGSFIIYKNIYPNPRNWYDHYLYLTKSLIQNRVDIPELPTFYHDKLEFEGKTYIPFPPAPAILLIPFVLVDNNITQQQVSIIVGALDVALLYLLLLNFTSKRNSVILSLFLGFGTPFFWSALVGTTWFFSHIVAIFFIELSLILYFRQKYFLSGILFALSALTRLPLILAGMFYLLQLFRTKIKFLYFLIGASVFVPLFLLYNYLRFGSLLETGYGKVYGQYNNSDIKVSISENFGYFNYKNLPLHLYTFFIMPPNVTVSEGLVKDLKPSPFGMGIIFTSPLLLIALWPKFKRGIELNSIITAFLVSLPSFFHYAQGWVQFGYRFLLDFIVFLMIILALRFKPTKLNLILISISIIVNYWGVLWATKLGW